MSLIPGLLLILWELSQWAPMFEWIPIISPVWGQLYAQKIHSYASYHNLPGLRNKNAKSTSNVDTNLRLEEVEIIFIGTCSHIAIRHTHVWRINVRIVAKETISWPQKSFLLHHCLDRCRTGVFDLGIQQRPRALHTACILRPNFFLHPQKNLTGPNSIALT